MVWMSPSTTTRRIRCPTALKLFPARTVRRTTARATPGHLPLRRLWAAQRFRSSMGPIPTGRGAFTSLTTLSAQTSAWSTPAGVSGSRPLVHHPHRQPQPHRQRPQPLPLLPLRRHLAQLQQLLTRQQRPPQQLQLLPYRLHLGPHRRQGLHQPRGLVLHRPRARNFHC